LQYSLDHEDLALGSSRGVSNIVEQAIVNISLDQGMLLCILSPGDLN
jgi:thiamine pyrophosphokinase